jgi:hypothetical protein
MARKGLPVEGTEEAATGTTKKGRGPIKAGVFVPFSDELASEIKAIAARFGKGNPKRTALAHQDITDLIGGAHQEFAKSHLGNVGKMLLEDLNRRAGNPLEDAVK